jgi:hypothetical protein
MIRQLINSHLNMRFKSGFVVLYQVSFLNDPNEFCETLFTTRSPEGAGGRTYLYTLSQPRS